MNYQVPGHSIHFYFNLTTDMTHTVPHHLQLIHTMYLRDTFGSNVKYTKCTVCIYNFTSYSTLPGATACSPSNLYLPYLHFIDDWSTHIPNHDAFGCHKNTGKKSASASNQQTPIFDIEHIKHYYRHQQALQSIQYLGSCLGMVTRDQKILEKQMCSRAKQRLQQQDMYHQTRAASASWKQIWQWSSFLLFWSLPYNCFYSTVMYLLWYSMYCKFPDNGYGYSYSVQCSEVQ